MAEASSKTPKKSAPKTVKPDAADTKTEPKKAVAKAAPKKTAPPAPSKPVAVKKSAPKAAAPAAKASPPRKAAAAKKTLVNTGAISDEQRYRMIAEAAYYRAESCQFKSDPLRDWIEAERDIAILLKESV